MGLVGCAPAGSDPEAIKVGVLLPFTGRNGGPSQNFEHAVLLARAHLQAVGLGGHPVEVIFQDTHSDVDRGLAGADALVARGVAAIIGPESGELADALLPRLAAASVLLISPGISPEPATASAGPPWFRVAPSTRAMAENLARRLVDLKIARVLILATTDRYNASFAASFKARFEQLGGMGVERTLPDDQVSYSEIVPELMAADHVLLAVRAETAARVVNEMSVFQEVPRWHLTPALRTEAFVLNASPEALADAIGVSPDVEVEPDFAAAFADYWDGDAPLESALFYYDAMALFAMGYERAYRRQMGAPGAALLAESIFAVTFPNGVATRWTELAAGISDLREGRVRYYRGLTGSIVLATDGQRGIGKDKAWTVGADGAIVDVK